MATGLLSPPDIRTVADLLARLGRIPAARVRWSPLPGTATKADVIAIAGREERLCELVDGVLVEKATGPRQSALAVALSGYLCRFVNPRRLGLVSGAAGMVELLPGLVRIPDVAFVSWARVPGGRVLVEPVPDLVPDLVVEVLSRGNTAGELARKRCEYFSAGVRLIWIAHPVARTVTVYTAPDQSRMLGAAETLDGAPVLPGFTLPLRDLFAELDRSN